MLSPDDVGRRDGIWLPLAAVGVAVWLRSLARGRRRPDPLAAAAPWLWVAIVALPVATIAFDRNALRPPWRRLTRAPGRAI